MVYWKLKSYGDTVLLSEEAQEKWVKERAGKNISPIVVFIAEIVPGIQERLRILPGTCGKS